MGWNWVGGVIVSIFGCHKRTLQIDALHSVGAPQTL